MTRRLTIWQDQARRCVPSQAGRKEFAGLLRSGQSRLKDAATRASHSKSRSTGLQAAHALCLRRFAGMATVRATATSSSRSCPTRSGLGPEVWRVLDKCHKCATRRVRGRSHVDDRLVTDLIAGVPGSGGQVKALKRSGHHERVGRAQLFDAWPSPQQAPRPAPGRDAHASPYINHRSSWLGC